MQIENIVCSKRTEARLESKHHVALREARQIFFSSPRIRFAEKGHIPGEDVYAYLVRRSAADISQSFSSTTQSFSSTNRYAGPPSLLALGI